jgi:DNA polymerase III epsilon subunit-like protein
MMTPTNKITYISIDIETAGPNPSRYAMLSIGACLVSDPEVKFYVELKPNSMDFVPEALAVGGLSLKELSENGLAPEEGLQRLKEWLGAVVPSDSRPIFTAFNAPFDWSFINEYFHRYLGQNPFGHSALDIKAYYMGAAGVEWEETSMKSLFSTFPEAAQLSHNALEDAQQQARLFNRMLSENKFNEKFREDTAR